MRDFRELLESDGIYVFDGAMGTRLYEKGIYINRSYDELNLSNKDLVRDLTTAVSPDDEVTLMQALSGG